MAVALSVIAHLVVYPAKAQPDLQDTDRGKKTVIENPEAPFSIVEVTPILQPVNETTVWDSVTKEAVKLEPNSQSTFRILIRNHRHHPIQIDRAELLVDSVGSLTVDSRVRTYHTQRGVPWIDHDGHICSPISYTFAGDAIPVDLDLRIPSAASREVTVWFPPEDINAVILRIGGRFRFFAGGVAAESDPVKLRLHMENQRKASWTPASSERG